jgi:hypothetical protein
VNVKPDESGDGPISAPSMMRRERTADGRGLTWSTSAEARPQGALNLDAAGKNNVVSYLVQAVRRDHPAIRSRITTTGPQSHCVAGWRVDRDDVSGFRLDGRMARVCAGGGAGCPDALPWHVCHHGGASRHAASDEPWASHRGTARRRRRRAQLRIAQRPDRLDPGMD